MKTLFRNKKYRIFFYLFTVSFFTFVLFKFALHDSGPVNRIAMCLGILEDGTLTIDKYHHLTEDLCIRDGHYYNDKAPGESFLALPFVAAGYYVMTALGVKDFASFDASESPPECNDDFKVLMILGTLAPSFFSALGIACMYLLGRQLGASDRMAVLAALMLGFGTQYRIWGSVMYAHSLVAAFLVISLTIGLHLLQKDPASTGNRLSWIGLGFLMAYTVWTEYTTAVPICLVGVYFLGVDWKERRNPYRTFALGVLLALGAVPVATGFLIYNTVCFGGPLSLGYHFVTTNFPKMNEGVFGITAPDWAILQRLIFGHRAEIVWASPFFLASPLLAVRNILKDRQRGLNILALIIPAYFFLLTSAYAYPHPRHTVPCLPFVVIPFLSGWGDLNRIFRTLIDVSIVLGLYLSTTVLLAGWSPEYYAAPLPTLYATWGLISGKVIPNLLTMAGFSAYFSMAVVFLVWGIFAVILCRELRTERTPPPHEAGKNDPVPDQR